MATMEVGGKDLAFYRSSKGTSGKTQGNWYPFFGIGERGWIIKGGVSQMESGYGNPEIKGAMDWLNNNYSGSDPEVVFENVKSKSGLAPSG
jgi:hypothetical protein